MTGDLHALTDWLLSCGVDTVALESTGVYWIPLYEARTTSIRGKRSRGPAAPTVHRRSQAPPPISASSSPLLLWPLDPMSDL